MKNYLEFTEGEITIYCGENARNTVNESLKLASAIGKSKRKGNILYINTVFTTRKILAAARTYIAPKSSPAEGNIVFHNISVGELCNSFGTIGERIEEENIKYVIINSWEFANRSYTYKERSIFELKGLLAEAGVTLLIYSQSKLAKPGKIQRSGLGKLSALADDIIQLEEEYLMDEEADLEKQSHTPIPPYAHTPAHEMLVASKINELDYAREDIRPLSGGELVMQEEEVMEMQN